MQKINQLPQLTGQNPYNEVYQDFQNNEDLKAYYSEFVEKPFFEENKQLFQISKISGYFSQVFSSLTASTLVYFFIFDMLNIAFVAATMTIGVLLLLEASKRNIAGNVFTTYVKYSEPSQRYNKGLISILSLLIALSIAFSFFGAQRIVKEMTNAPSLVEANTTDLKTQIEGIDQQIKTAEQQTNNKGKILYKVIPTLTSLNNQKAVLQQRIFDIENQTAEENATITTTHQTTTDIKAEYFALVTFLLEFMFLLTAYYCKYYKYRSLVELSLLNQLEFNTYQQTVTTEAPPPLVAEKKTALPEPTEEKILDKEANNDAKTILEEQNHHEQAEQIEANTAHKKALNGTPINNTLERRTIGFKLHNDNRINENRIDGKQRSCLYCNNAYIYNHKKQKFCCDKCRIANWQEKTGKELKMKKRKV